MSIIEMKQVYKTYNENTEAHVDALKNASIVIEEGDFLAIMGESGSGKSTLLNVLTTILPATKGEVIINGKEVKSMSEEEISKIRYASLSYIFQDFNLLNNLNIYENIALPLMMKGDKNPAEIQAIIQDVATKLGISTLLDKYPIECSGGQQQRIAIARTMAANPQIIVADEPTGNLDSQNSKEIMDLFATLNREGMTIIMVTHDSKVASYSKKMIYIHDGSIINEIIKAEQSVQAYYTKIVSLTSSRGVFA